MKQLKGKMKEKFQQPFSVFDLVLIAMLTAVSIGFKTVVGILVRMVTSPLGIPGGAIAGGFYMLWLPLAIAITGKHFSALMVAVLQTLIMILTGAPGSHGVWTVITYILPALLVEIVFLFSRKNTYSLFQFFLATILANVVGTIFSNLLFFKLEWMPFLFVLLTAGFSGAIGGIVGYFAFKGIEKSGVLKREKANSELIKIFDEENIEENNEKKSIKSSLKKNCIVTTKNSKKITSAEHQQCCSFDESEKSEIQKEMKSKANFKSVFVEESIDVFDVSKSKNIKNETTDINTTNENLQK